MIRKKAKNLLRSARTKALSGVDQKIDRLTEGQAENNRLVRELIIEQRNREDKDKYLGTFQSNVNEIATKLFNGMIMYLDPRDIAVVPHIIFESIWEKEITRAWLSVFKKKDMVVFDIGANFGYFALLSAQKLDRKNSKVVLFEANPNLIPYIDKTLSVNWMNENTIVENKAVSDKIGKSELNVLKDYTGSSSMHSIEHLDNYLSHKMQIKAESKITVDTVTIDSYCAENNIKNIDLIKMDIEGYEENAYEGMSNIVKSSPNLILFIEFTKDGYKNPKKYYEKMLKDFGNVYSIDGEGKFVTPKITNYDSVIGSVDDWIMLVFSKKALN